LLLSTKNKAKSSPEGLEKLKQIHCYFQTHFSHSNKAPSVGVPGFNITLGYNKYTDLFEQLPFLSSAATSQLPNTALHRWKIHLYNNTSNIVIRGVYWLSEHKIQTAFLPCSDLHYVVGQRWPDTIKSNEFSLSINKSTVK